MCTGQVEASVVRTRFYNEIQKPSIAYCIYDSSYEIWRQYTPGGSDFGLSGCISQPTPHRNNKVSIRLTLTLNSPDDAGTYGCAVDELVEHTIWPLHQDTLTIPSLYSEPYELTSMLCYNRS